MTGAEVRRLDATEHGLNAERVSPNALDVTAKLQDAGYAGLIVGGCVRDLLLGHTPKDFDVELWETYLEMMEQTRYILEFSPNQ